MTAPPPDPDPAEAPSRYPGTPRWVKALAVIAVVALLLVVFIMVTGLGGVHGPQRHGASEPTAADPVVRSASA